MNSQAESMKSFNVTEGRSQGSSRSHTTTDGTSTSEGVSTTKRDYSKLGKLAMQETGLALAASFFRLPSLFWKVLQKWGDNWWQERFLC